MSIHSPRRATPPAGLRRQLGGGMIEILVAVVILAFGLLGLVGLQSKVLVYSQSSLYRSQATALTDDILDRLRADRANAKAGQWNSALTTASSDSSLAGSTPLSKADLRQWKQQVEALLPEGQASISVASGEVTIILQWNDDRDTTGTNRLKFETKSKL